MLTNREDKRTKQMPELFSELRQSVVHLPKVIRNASGISIYGKRIKSIIYTMDVALIANNDADAILEFTHGRPILEYYPPSLK